MIIIFELLIKRTPFESRLTSAALEVSSVNSEKIFAGIKFDVYVFNIN